MKTRTRNIVRYIGIGCTLLLIGAYGVGCLWLLPHYTEQPACHTVLIHIQDAQQYNFVSPADVTQQMKRYGLNPVGQVIAPALAHRVEQSIEAMPLVKQAECYCNQDGNLVLQVWQRAPVLHVLAGNRNYYVDDERKTMKPARHFTGLLPVLTGQVSEQAACGELYDFVLYLQADPFWSEQIGQVHVSPQGHVELSTRAGVPKIQLGSLSDYPTKLKKLYAWYEQYPAAAWGERYQQVNLSYEGLIYCK